MNETTVKDLAESAEASPIYGLRWIARRLSEDDKALTQN